MVDFSRHKSLQHNFSRVIVDKEHLYRLTCLVESTAVKYELKPNFEIKTPTGEDTITTNDPKFFVSEFMPISPEKITMSIREYDSPISMRLNFGEQNYLSAAGDQSMNTLRNGRVETCRHRSAGFLEAATGRDFGHAFPARWPLKKRRLSRLF